MVLKEEQFEKRKNEFYSLVSRQNGPPAFGGFSRPINGESLMLDSRRYTDPLIRDKIHDLANPAHRERVGLEDSIGFLLTWGFAMEAWDKYPKFYENEQLGAPEILPDLREFLAAIDFKELCIVVGAFVAIHGWCIVKPWADEKGVLRYEVFSDNQIRDVDWIRAPDHEVVGWRVMKNRRELPLRRTSEGVCISGHFEENLEIITREEVIYVKRGEGSTSLGFGYSRLESTWDAITKLREKSHADHFRSRVFPISIVPPHWDEDKVSEFFKALSLMDMSNAMVVRSAVDSQNNPVPELPSINWMSPAQSAPGQSQGTSGQGFSDLNSDWVRICTATHHTIAWFVGGGAISSSLAAAGVDMNSDLKMDITEFNNIYKTFILEFVEFLNEKYALGLPIDGSLAIKSHWEWTFDEKTLMLQQQQEEALKGPENNEKKTKNVAPGQYVPVNSTSGNVRLVGVEPAGPAENTDKIYVKFKEPYGWYKYSDPEMDVGQVSDDIAARGGDAVWDHLRGRDGGMGFPEKSAPNARRYDQQGNRLKYPNVGRAHLVNYMGAQGPGLGQGGGQGGDGGGSRQITTQQATAAGVLQHRGTAYSAQRTPLGPPPEEPVLPSGAEQWQEAEQAYEKPVEQQEAEMSREEFYEQKGLTRPETPRRGRPKKIVKGGAQRFYLPGVKGRVSQEQFLQAKKPEWEEQKRTSVEGIFEDIARRDYERYLEMSGQYQEQREEYEAKQQQEELTEEDFDDLEERDDPLSRIRKGLRKFTRGARKVARLGRMLTRNERELFEPEDFMHPWFQHYNSLSEVARELNIGKQSVYNALDGIDTATLNSATYLGNSFSTKNPFVYISNGFPTIEYQCPDAIKSLIGAEAPIIYSHANADEDTLEPINEGVVIGRYRIIGYDEEEGHEIAKYELFEDRISENGLDWLKQRINEGVLPETSTAYFNKLKYDRDRQRFVQTEFRLKHVAIVERGNCKTEYCGLLPRA